MERNIALLLFVTVLVIFSLAQKDTQKLDRLYTTKTPSIATEKPGTTASLQPTAAKRAPFHNLSKN